MGGFYNIDGMELIIDGVDDAIVTLANSILFLPR